MRKEDRILTLIDGKYGIEFFEKESEIYCIKKNSNLIGCTEIKNNNDGLRYLILRFFLEISNYNSFDEIESRIYKIFTIENGVLPTKYSREAVNYIINKDTNILLNICLENKITIRQLSEFIKISTGSLMSQISSGKIRKKTMDNILLLMNK